MAALGILIPGFEYLLIPYNLALLILFLVTGNLAKRWDPLSVRRQTDHLLSARVPNQVRLIIENMTTQSLVVKLRDDPPDTTTATTPNSFDLVLAPEEKVTRQYTIVPLERGSQPFEGTFVRFLAPLGLCWVQKQLANREEVRVYPNVQALKEFELLKQKGHLALMGIRKSRIKGLGQEFESLRDYHEDDFRKIDWKASARRNRLVVRNYEQEKNQAVVICVDVGRHLLAEVEGTSKIDHILDASLMLLHAAERAGDQTGLLLFNDVVKRYIAPKRGKAQVAAILNTIHDTRAEPVQPDYIGAFAYLGTRWKRRSLMIVFSDAENEDQARELLAALGHLAKRHLLLLVRVSDPRLSELTNLPIESRADLSRRASALWYKADRRKAEAVLRSGGFQTLDSEPSELSSKLVGAYLRVKELNLI